MNRAKQTPVQRDETNEVFDSPLALGDDKSSMSLRIKHGIVVLRMTDHVAYRGVSLPLSDSDLRDLHEWCERRLRSTGKLIDGGEA